MDNLREKVKELRKSMVWVLTCPPMNGPVMSLQIAHFQL